MHENELDQLFRDRLLDHRSKVRQGLWRQVHTHLVRHTAFWKWYFVGPSAIVVAVTGYIVLGAIHSPSSKKHATPAAAIATRDTRPATDSIAANPAAAASSTATASTATTANTTTAASSTTATSTAQSRAAAASSSTAASTTATTANPASHQKAPIPQPQTTAANSARSATPVRSEHQTATGSTKPTGSNPPSTRSNIAATAHPSATGLSAAHSTASSTMPGNRTHHRPGTHTADMSDNASKVADASSSSSLTNARSNTNSRTSSRKPANTSGLADADSSGSYSSSLASNGAQDQAANSTNASAASVPRPPIPAQLTAPAKLVALKTSPAVTAITPDSKKTHQLILPARPPIGTPPVHLDVFGSPEYFTNKFFGLSYGGGARVTFVYKNHWTLTSGVQYLRIAIPVNTKDSGSPSLGGNVKNLHMPLLLGYTVGNDRFTFAANAGVLLSLYAQAKGKMTEFSGGWPNRNGTSLYFSLDFSSHITNRISIFAEPYLKRWYIPYARPFPPQAWSTGLMVGVRYNF